MRLLGIGTRIRVALVTAVVLVVGLVSATSGSAAPRDNLLNARQCLRGGWHSLQTSSGRAFYGPLHCVVYALRGGVFGTTVPPAEEAPPVPPAPPAGAE